MAEDFVLDPLLVKDTVTLLDWPLCRVLLMNDEQYPWLVLVPRRAGLRDLDDVAPADEPALTAEIRRLSKILKRLTGAQKMNVAALGNVCPQLHVHVIARFAGDPAWPRPIWGVHPMRAYGADALAQRVATLKGALTEET